MSGEFNVVTSTKFSNASLSLIELDFAGQKISFVKKPFSAREAWCVIPPYSIPQTSCIHTHIFCRSSQAFFAVQLASRFDVCPITIVVSPPSERYVVQGGVCWCSRGHRIGSLRALCVSSIVQIKFDRYSLVSALMRSLASLFIFTCVNHCFVSVVLVMMGYIYVPESLPSSLLLLRCQSRHHHRGR